MDILFLLIPLSLALVALVVWALLWAVRSGQFEDLEGPAHRILMDDDSPRPRDSSHDQPASPEPGEPSAGDAGPGEVSIGDARSDEPPSGGPAAGAAPRDGPRRSGRPQSKR